MGNILSGGMPETPIVSLNFLEESLAVYDVEEDETEKEKKKTETISVTAEEYPARESAFFDEPLETKREDSADFSAGLSHFVEEDMELQFSALQLITNSSAKEPGTAFGCKKWSEKLESTSYIKTREKFNDDWANSPDPNSHLKSICNGVSGTVSAVKDLADGKNIGKSVCNLIAASGPFVDIALPGLGTGIACVAGIVGLFCGGGPSETELLKKHIDARLDKIDKKLQQLEKNMTDVAAKFYDKREVSDLTGLKYKLIQAQIGLKSWFRSKLDNYTDDFENLLLSAPNEQIRLSEINGDIDDLRKFKYEDAAGILGGILEMVRPAKFDGKATPHFELVWKMSIILIFLLRHYSATRQSYLILIGEEELARRDMYTYQDFEQTWKNLWEKSVEEITYGSSSTGNSRMDDHIWSELCSFQRYPVHFEFGQFGYIAGDLSRMVTALWPDFCFSGSYEKFIHFCNAYDKSIRNWRGADETPYYPENLYHESVLQRSYRGHHPGNDQNSDVDPEQMWRALYSHENDPIFPPDPRNLGYGYDFGFG